MDLSQSTWAFVLVVVVVLVALALVAVAAVTGVVRRRRHPDLPPTPEALEEQARPGEQPRITPGPGWGNGGSWS